MLRLEGYSGNNHKCTLDQVKHYGNKNSQHWSL